MDPPSGREALAAIAPADLLQCGRGGCALYMADKSRPPASLDLWHDSGLLARIPGCDLVDWADAFAGRGAGDRFMSRLKRTRKPKSAPEGALLFSLPSGLLHCGLNFISICVVCSMSCPFSLAGLN